MLFAEITFQSGQTYLNKYQLNHFSDGWIHETSYRFSILHNPDQDLIRVKLWEAGVLIVDTGDIIDEGDQSLKGGRLGVYCDSQEKITWSALSYK